MKWLHGLVALLIGLCILALNKPVLAFEFNSAPKKIIIPSVKISLPVFTAKIALNTWEVRTDGASFGESTTYPGRNGNSVIFSHATPPLFGNLSQVKKGDSIHLFTDYDWFVYKVSEIKIVDPENVEVLFSDGGHTLTLYTCTGPNDEKRLVVKAKLQTEQ